MDQGRYCGASDEGVPPSFAVKAKPMESPVKRNGVMQQLVGRADKKGQVAKFTARRASAHRCGLQAGLIEANVRSGYK